MLDLKIILNDPILREVYRRGIKQGTRWWAQWKEGKQVVGILEYDLEDICKRIDKGECD